MPSLEEEIGELLRRKSLTLGMVESATGGLISHLITNISGSSDYFKGGIVAYSNEIKTRVVGVKAATLKEHGAVSYEVAQEMAEGGKKVLGVDICVADTGIAGPGGATETKPLGLFYLGIAHGKGTSSEKHIFQGNRLQNKQTAARAALELLKNYLLGLPA
ncbi:MAG: CinA family protein [Dehalococcoidales bacterium]|nr:CinA family protein [Dehalococcoidales bacterium]